MSQSERTTLATVPPSYPDTLLPHRSSCLPPPPSELLPSMDLLTPTIARSAANTSESNRIPPIYATTHNEGGCSSQQTAQKSPRPRIKAETRKTRKTRKQTTGSRHQGAEAEGGRNPITKRSDNAGGNNDNNDNKIIIIHHQTLVDSLFCFRAHTHTRTHHHHHHHHESGRRMSIGR